MITEFFHGLDLLECLDMQFWLDGGWGVDVLYGQQTRLHRDIDIDFDANYTHKLLDLLQELAKVPLQSRLSAGDADALEDPLSFLQVGQHFLF